jgi:hypothetical protein
MTRLSKGDVIKVVNRYIGVHGGYLADFSYRTHAEFYPEFCDLDIDPTPVPGTTRERFITILDGSDAPIQARILRGVLKKYPAGSGELRTAERAAEIGALIQRLESAGPVSSSVPAASSAVVASAIADADSLLRTTGAPSGVDRMHTAFHGFLKAVCERAGIALGSDPSMTEIYGILRRRHRKLQDLGPHSMEIDRVLKALATALDSLNTIRNRATLAHPNDQILPAEEALLCINTVRTFMSYLDAKLG